MDGLPAGEAREGGSVSDSQSFVVFFGLVFLTIVVGILVDCAKSGADHNAICAVKSCASGTPAAAYPGRCVCVVGEAK